MKHKFTIWMLLIGALLLGAFILFFERDSETSRQQELRSRTVFSAYPDSIEQFLLERNGVQIECTRSGGTWRMTRPVDAPVDSGIVEKMIAGMARVERGELISAETLQARGLTPADYGFDAPRAKITFKNNRGTFTWLIGRDAPLGDALYVKSNSSDDIISAPKTLLNLIPEDPAWIRDRVLFAGETPTVRGLDMTRPSGPIQLRLTEDSGWQIQQPVTGRANLQAMHTFIDKILSGRVVQFISDEKTDLAAYGLDKPDIEVTLFMQNESTQTVRVGKPLPDHPDQRYAKRIESDSVFTVPSTWTDELEHPLDSLRSRTLTDLPVNRISAVHLTRGDRQIELTKTNKAWQVVRPVRWPADPGRVNDLLNTLAGASIDTFIDAPTEEQSARMKSALWEAVLSSGEKSCTLKVSAPGTNDLRLAEYSGESSLYAIGAGTVRESFADPLFYRSPLVLEVDPAAIEQITVQSGETEETVRKSDTGSFVSEPSGGDVSAGALTDLMWALNDLKASRYVAFSPESLQPYGLDTVTAKLSVTLEGTNALGHVLLLGNPTDGGRFAMLQGQDVIFVLPEKTVQTLTKKLTVEVTEPN